MSRSPNNASKQSGSSGGPEPVPDWTKARKDWNLALPLHTYGFGIAFFAFAIYGMFILVKLKKSSMRASRNYFICISILICMFGFSRATVLLLDPYTLHRPVKFPRSLGLILFSLGYPCLTSGFFLINWSLIEVTRLQLLPNRIHQHKVLVLVSTIHFTVVMSFDSLFSFYPSAYLLLFFCRMFFILWGVFLFGGFIYSGRRIQCQVKNNLRTLATINNYNKRPSQSTSSRNNMNVITISTTMHNVSQNQRQARTRKVMNIANRAAAIGLLICITQIYALWEFYVFYKKDVKPKAWPWLIYQTCFRFIELFMVTQMLRIVRPPKLLQR